MPLESPLPNFTAVDHRGPVRGTQHGESGVRWAPGCGVNPDTRFPGAASTASSQVLSGWKCYDAAFGDEGGHRPRKVDSL